MSHFSSSSSFSEDEPGAPIVPGSRSFLHNLELEPSTTSITPIIPDQKHDFMREEGLLTRAGGETTIHTQTQSGHHWDVEEEQPQISRKELHITPIQTHTQTHRRTLDTLVIITPPTSSTSTHTTHIESSPSSSSSTTSSSPLTVAPFFIEHGTSFICTTTISSVMSALSRVLDRMHVDYTRKPEKNKIKGVYHHNTLSCPFQIRLYRSADSPSTPPSPSTNQSILVEFQRRNGCPLTFHTFYQQTNELFWEELDGNSNHTLQGEQQHHIDVAPVDDASVVLLYGMASSPYHDVSKEGLRALAHVSYTDENQVKLSHMSSTTSLSSLPLSAAPSPATLSLLQHVLSSTDDEMRRIASILVNNLSHQDVMRTPIVTELLDAMITILESTITIESRESQRQVVKALATMSETHADALCAYRKNKQTLIQILSKHQTSQDQILQSYVQLILQRLQNVIQ